MNKPTLRTGRSVVSVSGLPLSQVIEKSLCSLLYTPVEYQETLFVWHMRNLRHELPLCKLIASAAARTILIDSPCIIDTFESALFYLQRSLKNDEKRYALYKSYQCAQPLLTAEWVSEYRYACTAITSFHQFAQAHSLKY